MKNLEVSRQLQSLDALILKAAHSTQDVELLSHWARYFCVRTAGILENGITEIYSEYVVRTSSPPVANYASSRLARIQNPNSERFLETARHFDTQWAATLENFLDDNGRKDAIDSIMNVRHQIAHGQNAGITISRISEYLRKAEEVLEFIETQVRPN